jgi:hypothetical protein
VKDVMQVEAETPYPVDPKEILKVFIRKQGSALTRNMKIRISQPCHHIYNLMILYFVPWGETANISRIFNLSVS